MHATLVVASRMRLANALTPNIELSNLIRPAACNFLRPAQMRFIRSVEGSLWLATNKVGVLRRGLCCVGSLMNHLEESTLV
jgi:hypothetical protein